MILVLAIFFLGVSFGKEITAFEDPFDADDKACGANWFYDRKTEKCCLIAPHQVLAAMKNPLKSCANAESACRTLGGKRLALESECEQMLCRGRSHGFQCHMAMVLAKLEDKTPEEPCPPGTHFNSEYYIANNVTDLLDTNCRIIQMSSESLEVCPTDSPPKVIEEAKSDKPGFICVKNKKN